MINQVHDQRRARVRLELLKALDRVSGFMLRENILYADLNLHLSPPATVAEYRKELESLEAMSMIVILADSLGGPRQVKITAAGSTEVAAQHP
jgi:hypothetical protein